MPHASGDRASPAGDVPDLRHGAGAPQHYHEGSRKSRTARDDAALLAEPSADSAVADDRDGRHAARNAGPACSAWWLAAVAGVAARHTGCPVGRLAIFSAWMGVRSKPLDQHVHPDRDGHGCGLPVQPGHDHYTGHFSCFVPRDRWNTAGLLRSGGGDHYVSALGTGTGTACAQPHWGCDSGLARFVSEDGQGSAQWSRGRYSSGTGAGWGTTTCASGREGSGRRSNSGRIEFDR